MLLQPFMRSTAIPKLQGVLCHSFLPHFAAPVSAKVCQIRVSQSRVNLCNLRMVLRTTEGRPVQLDLNLRTQLNYPIWRQAEVGSRARRIP